MRYFFHKYTSKFIFCTLSFVFILSCVQRHKFDFEKNQLSDKKMSAVMTDILLMESYVTEKMPDVSWDTISMVKMQFYKKILAKHKVDSVAFYTTFNYLQAHPKEFEVVLKLVDSSLTKINPGDTTFIQPVVTIPKNIGNLPNFKEQEKAMQGEFIKKIMRSQDKKTKDEE